MDLPGYLKKSVAIVKLDGSVAAAVARDERAIGPGLLFVATSGVALGLCNLLFHHGSVGGLVVGAVAALLLSCLGVGALHLAATSFFGARGDFVALYRAEALASIIGWALLIPFVGVIAGLWHLPVSVVILQSVYAMSREKAIAAVATILAFLLLLGLLVAFSFGAFVVGFMGAMPGWRGR